MIIAIGPAKITAKPPYGNENSANDDENDIEQKLNQYGTSATETKITARQKNSAVISRGRADRSPCKQESPLLARKRVAFGEFAARYACAAHPKTGERTRCS